MGNEMTVIIAGGPRSGLTPPRGLETAANVQLWTSVPAEAGNSAAGLARALAAFEADVSGQQVDSIVLVDDSDAALAAALVGVKLPVEVVATPAARDAATVNGRLIAQLAGAYTAPA
jgi:hypothetical protein